MSRHVRLHRWSADDLATAFAEQHSWVSPVVEADFDVVSVIPSWTAQTPDGTWVEVAARREVDAPWLVVARWAETDGQIRRTSVPAEPVDGARVETDEVRVDAEGAWRSAQLRITAARDSNSGAWPVLGGAALAVSGARTPLETSRGSGVAHDVDVPAYAQHLYRDQLATVGGGGQNWCSPTAVSMVLSYWGGGPTVDPVVPYAAAQTFDEAYGGTGNWSFNTAYAGRFGLDAFVTRLRSFDEAEAFTRAGVPLVLSVAFTRAELDGAGYDTDGHLLVLAGFDAAGDPVVNDPAAHGTPDADQVRTTYRRDQLERAWLQSADGVVYVIHPHDVALPKAPPEPNW